MITKLGTDYFKGQKQDIYLIASTVTSDGELKSTQSGKTFGTCSCKAMEKEDGTAYINEKDPEAPITAAQVKFFYAAASRHGLTKPEAKALVKKFGYDSASKIKTKDFDAMLAELGGTEE